MIVVFQGHTVRRCASDGASVASRLLQEVWYTIRGMATQVFESGGIREEAGTVGAGAGVGGVVGGILGGVKGAIIGAVIGAGGAIAATEGKDVHLPTGSIIRIRLDTAVDVG